MRSKDFNAIIFSNVIDVHSCTVEYIYHKIIDDFVGSVRIYKDWEERKSLHHYYIYSNGPWEISQEP